ncbi:MAG: thiamine-phosphate kinase, partial [Pseudomonadota bacterium]
VPTGQALLRSAAKAGDDIYVSGTLGDARLALEVHHQHLSLSSEALAFCQRRMDRPSPRVALGQALRGLAHAAADISDGLIGDLGHILKASGVGAELDLTAVRSLCQTVQTCPLPEALLDTCTLTGGDDYELVFTAPQQARSSIEQAAARCQTVVTRVGKITADSSLIVRLGDQAIDTSRLRSFDHFN